MDTMNFDRWLAVGGLAVGLVGILVAVAVPIYFYRKGLRPKLLAVAYNGAFALMQTVPGVTVTYLGSVRTALSRTNILLWNRGASPIEEMDFAGPIEFTDAEVLVIEIVHKDPMAIASIEGHKLKIGLLRPSEAIVVKIELEKFDRPNFVIPVKATNMIEIIRRVPGVLYPLPVVFGFVFLIGSFIFFVNEMHRFGFDPPNFTFVPILAILASAALGGAGIWLGYLLRKKFIPSIPYRFLTAEFWQDISQEKLSKKEGIEKAQ